MKKIYYGALVLLMCWPMISRSQVVVQVGNATTTTTATGPTLLGTLWEDNVDQLLFTASELTAAGLFPGFINALEFNFTSLGSPNPTSFGVSIATTNQTPPLTGFLPQAILTSVYSGNPNITSGWNTFTFSQPFFWNGTDNLIIQTCHNNSTWSGNYGTQYTATSQNTHWGVNADGIANGCDPNNYSGSGSGSTTRANVKFHIVPAYANDAGVLAIDSPAVPACVLGNNVYVTLHTLGTAPLTSATINWAVNGINMSPVTWTGNIQPYASEDSIFVGTYGFTNGDQLLVWTTNPNGVTDSLTSNDSLTIALYTSMNGLYTIGGSGSDYPDFTSAVSDLHLKGVCGPVTFNVNNGTYPEQLVINPIAGASSANTITFQSTSGDSTLVTLTTAGTSTDNYVVHFNGASHITFKGMTIDNTNTTYGRVLAFTAGADHNTVTNNILITPNSSSTSDFRAVIYANGINNGATISNNIISGGSYGIYWYGVGTASRFEDLTVENNEIINHYYRGIYTYYSTNTELRGNVISTNNPYSFGYMAMALYYANGSYEVIRNRTEIDNTGSYSYPLYMYYAEAPGNDRGVVSNNFFATGSASATSYHYGTYMYYSTNFDYVHNNINLLSSSTSDSYGIYSTGGGGMRFINNNFINATGGGYAMYITGSFVFESDYNNLYSPNGTSIAYFNSAYTTLNDWQSGTGFDMNSLSTDANYKSDYELYPCSDTLDGMGTIIPGITADIDGEVRNPYSPDIGADEFIAGKPNLGPDTTVCAGTPVILNAFGPSNSIINWNTAATTPSITVNFPGTYIINAVSICGIPGSDTIVVTHLDPPVAAFTGNTSYLGVTFNNTSTSATSYQWDFGDGSTSTLEHPEHIFANSGYHQITLIATNDCGSDTVTEWILLSVVGMDEMDSGISSSVYPNPSSGNTVLTLGGLSNQRVTVTITDLNGRTLFTEVHQISSDTYNTALNLEGTLANGVYLIRVQHDNGSLMKRLVVH